MAATLYRVARNVPLEIDAAQYTHAQHAMMKCRATGLAKKPATTIRSQERKPSIMVQADEKIELILQAARDLFSSRGYDTTSMDLVAREAAVSKATVYSHFRSKEQLLLTLVEAEVNQLPLARHPRPPATAAELRDALTGMAEEFVMIFEHERTRSLCRLVMAQAHMYPQIARAFYEAAPVRTRREVVEVLDGAVAAGLLNIQDTSLAATQFLNLAGGELPMLSLLSLPLTRPDVLRVHIESAINVFLAGYGTDTAD